MTDLRLKLRGTLREDRCIYCPSVFDPLSARSAEALGFEMGILGGSVASLMVTGAPDTNVLTLTELAEQAMRICRASNLPLIVDADNGYGNALNVMRTVEELERSGVAAITVEDTRIPRAYAQSPTALIGIDEATAKLGAAVAARRDPNLMLIARTSAAGADNDADIVARLRSYARAGVDAVCVVGVRDHDQLAAVASATALPLLYISYAGGELGTLRDLHRQGVRAWVDGHSPYFASVQAAYGALKHLRERDDDLLPPPGVVPADLLSRLSRRADFDHWASEYLGAGD